jgi:gluconolactonase
MKFRIKALYIALVCSWTVMVTAQGTVNLPESMADPGVVVEPVLTGLHYCEGPAFDSAGNLYFTEDPDYMDGKIWKVTPEGVSSVFMDPSNSTNGLEFDPAGRLVACRQDQVIRMNQDGSIDTLVESGGNLDLGKVNDLSVASSGAMYFTNLNGGSLFYRSPQGSVQEFIQFERPNGVEWIEEKSFLYLASGSSLLKCPVNPDGTVGTHEIFAEVQGPDGLTSDVNGNVYIASWVEGAIKVFDSSGISLGEIIIDHDDQGERITQGQNGNASNCHFGFPDTDMLYITGDGGCHRVQLKIAGRSRPGEEPVDMNFRPGTWLKKKISIGVSSNIFNPAEGPLRLRVSAPYGSDTFIGILDVNCTLRGRMLPGKIPGLKWDGTGFGNRPLTPGKYFLVLSQGGIIHAWQSILLLR